MAEQNQLTDRFTKAVDQLDRAGADHLQARLGGIYALERLSLDSPRDYSTITEVLSAFIRSAAPRPQVDGLPEACPDRPPTFDVQAALTVLGRRGPGPNRQVRPGFYDVNSVDLSQTCLRHVDFLGADFSRANFRQADLTKARLIGVDLIGALFVGANLSGVDFAGSDLGSALLTDTDLGGANLTDSLHTEETMIDGARTDEATTGAWWR
ncbi:pentapeptide repeat-containing protein [Umezawaea sp. Da 62-37]|uniref:pentapeptide repeat-containing protein n=1 Tax=Umezawaea sp. Da 62-37 TaxID=3075927 RepID=UPI0028F6FDB9|nr:pentapeptide repeat-containing protein [Umezawaea sp. Da 62-37]WNV86673.1 pentapeptide repeat-containing protein [Umezawaea sp. Da 62-37]WNV86744.1 pentapeptide repeat-containing protein [Umezawaea sp. Da 62-37]